MRVAALLLVGALVASGCRTARAPEAAPVEAPADGRFRPPAWAGPFALVEVRDLGYAGMAYRYIGEEARLDVFVYPPLPDVTADDTVEQTLRALRVEEDRGGQVEGVRTAADTTLSVEWGGQPVPVRHVTLALRQGGVDVRSHLYLMERGAAWVKVRVVHEEGRMAGGTLDRLVLALLADG